MNDFCPKEFYNLSLETRVHILSNAGTLLFSWSKNIWKCDKYLLSIDYMLAKVREFGNDLAGGIEAWGRTQLLSNI